MRDTTLTPDQLKARKNGLGGTDAKKIMDGDWLPLWEEKTGRREPDDLTGIFKVQLGIETETFNLAWLEKVQGWNLQYHPGKTFIDVKHHFMLCHPDALATIGEHDVVIDAKHLGPYAPWNNEEAVMQRYYWQAQHNMVVLARDRFILSCIWGNEWRDPLTIEADPGQQKLLIEREKAFWWHVEDDSPPASDPDHIIEAPIVPMDDMRTVDMEGNNEWCSEAVTFLDNQDGAKKFESAKKELKTKIEADVKHAFGHGAEGVRAKNGNLTIRPIKEKK